MSAQDQPTASPSGFPSPRRRLVTGHDEAGKAVISMDGLLESQDVFRGQIRATNIWTTESTPTRDNNLNEVDGAARPVPGLGLMMPNGTNHRFTDLAPGATTPMHRSNTLDYNIILSGRIVLILDDDVRTEVQPGEVVIQRGTIHGWHNPSSTEWAQWVTVLIHAEPAEVNGKALDEAWKPDQ